MSWVFVVVGIALLVLLHELGHFAAAKAVGMRAERFALFFPPYLARYRRGETEYCLGSIPLGGFVRITGMNPNEEVPEEVAPRAYFRQPVWKRVVVIAAGPAVNLVIAFVVIAALLVLRGAPTGSAPVVDSLQAGQPAAAVLRPGDRILAVDGVRGDTAALRRQIGTHRCAGAQRPGCSASTPAVLTVERGGRELTVRVRPKFNAELGRPLAGFAFAIDYEPEPVLTAAGDSVQAMWRITRLTVESIAKLFYDSEARKDVSGIVGTSVVTQQTTEKRGLDDGIELLALISLSLAVINLFPFLPLDGGHIFWALSEKVRRRPISFQVMERASVVGFVLVVMLFALGLTNDIDRLTGEGFGVR